MAEATDKKTELLAAWRQRWRAADFTWAGLESHELQGWVVEGGVLREAETGRVYGTPLLPLPPVEGEGRGEGGSAAQEPSALSPRTTTPPPHPGPLPLPGERETRPATLQDYWRADPATGRLRDPKEMLRAGEIFYRSGLNLNDYRQHVRELRDDAVASVLAQPELYHIAHLPLEWDDGAATGKADWAGDALDAITGARLAAASETMWEEESDERKIVGPDRDAQMQGAVRAKAPAHPGGKEAPLSLRLSLALIFGTCDFAQARFSGAARFESATFAGDAWFTGAAFGGDAWFTGAAFGGDAWFTGAAFSRETQFHAAAFEGLAGFASVTFGSGATFEQAVFNGYAEFGIVTFEGMVGFANARFAADASFDGTAFNEDAWFQEAVFERKARFDRARFRDSAGFGNTTFSGEATFHQTEFHGMAWFADAKFETYVRFEAATFKSPAYFRNCLFVGLATFDYARFQADMDFSASIFEKLVSFERIIWPPSDAAHWHGAFDQTLFRATLSLAHSGFKSFAAFDGATLERGVQIDEADEAAAKRTFKSERRAAIAAADKGTDRDARLRQLERGCRVLKLAFEQSANKSREQMMYRFELQARRAQRKLPPGEALFSDLYALASDYGASMVRPFIALGVIIILFGAAFYAWAYLRDFIGTGPDHIPAMNAAWQALDLSWANVFKPLSALSAEATEQSTLADKLFSDLPGLSFALRALATLQSLLAIVLAFLFALAVRRRFQIS